MNGYVYLVGAGPVMKGLLQKSDGVLKSCRYRLI